MQIQIPELALIVLISKSDKMRKIFLEKYFDEEEIGHIGVPQQQLINRLERAKLTVIESESAEIKDHGWIMKLAKQYHCMPIAVFLCNLSDEQEDVTNQVVSALEKEGFKKIILFKNEEEIERVTVERVKLANNKRNEHGPFDLIGDVHGCYDELCELLEKLGYRVDVNQYTVYSPENRKVVFLGDLVDRGPKITEVLKLVMSMVKEGQGYCVLGNHDGKLLRKLKGANVQVIHGLEVTLEQLAKESPQFIEQLKVFLEQLVSHYVLDEGKLIAVHAGLKEKFHGRESARIRDLAMFGETTGKLDELGLPIRLKWSDSYAGKACVVYGHTPVIKAKLINNTINVDTGCIFGGKLTAFRYPEKEVVEVKAKKVYCESVRPLAEPDA